MLLRHQEPNTIGILLVCGVGVADVEEERSVGILKLVGGRTQLKPADPNHPRSLRLATIVRQIARAGLGAALEDGGGTGKDRDNRGGDDS